MRRSGRGHRASATTVATAALVGAAALLATSPAGAATTPMLREVGIRGYGPALSNARGFTLYVMNTERGGKIVCKGACLKAWPPLLVSAKTTKVTFGPAVKGKIGFVRRSATTKQVTYNGYPLYTFVGDAKPDQANGEGIKHFGGTWYMVRPKATTVAATAILPRKIATTAATKTTTKTGSSSGSGW